MAFVFPDDKADFLAPNGVTYSWDGTKWVTKTYKKEADGRLPYRLGTDKAARSARSGEPAIELVDAKDNYSNVKFFGVNGIQIESTISGIQFDGSELLGGEGGYLPLTGGTITGELRVNKPNNQPIFEVTADKVELQKHATSITQLEPKEIINVGILDNLMRDPGQYGYLTGLATVEYSDTEDAKLQNQIDELSVSRGKVARYKVDNTIGTPVIRPGELSVNIPFWPNTTAVSFGVEDLDGTVTKPIAVGDIIDFVDNATEKLSRYRVTDAASAPSAVGVEYISGDGDWAVNQEKQVYIYPQNQAGASKDYVDAQDALLLPLTGGTIDGLMTVTFTNAQADNAYVFNVQGSRLPEGQNSAFRVTAGGSVKAGHSSGAPFMATAANDLITKAYFDANQGGDVNLSGYLPLSGGTLTNALCFNRGEKPNVQLCIEPNSGSTDTNIYSLSDGQMRFRTSHTSDINDRNGSHIVLDPNNGEPETKIYHLVSPTNATMAANRQYVDQIAASPAHLQWQYNGVVDNADDPGSGNMVWHAGGTDGILGYLRFSFVTRDGLTDLGDGKFDDTIVSMEYGPVGTVWQWRSDVGKWKLMLQFRFKQFRWNYNNHFELGLTSQNGRRFEDIANAGYFVTVGGFF